jgi:hypothetical protein
MSEPPRIGIVDSGVRGAVATRVGTSAAFVLDGNAVSMTPATEDRIGHGTVVTEIITACAPQADVYVAQVFGTRFTTTAAQVAAAIDWLCAQSVQVINLSLGLRDDRHVLALACARAVASGVVVCAASPAQGAPVYPAAYAGVLRMTGDARCAPDEVSALASTQADFGAHVLPPDGTREGAGASIGCAWLVGHIGRLIAEGCAPDTASVRKALSAIAHYHGPERRVC